MNRYPFYTVTVDLGSDEELVVGSLGELYAAIAGTEPGTRTTVTVTKHESENVVQSVGLVVED
jgi:hypothetical protein